MSDGTFAAKAKHLASSFGVLLAAMLIASWVVRRDIDIPGLHTGITATLVWCTGLVLFLWILFQRPQKNPVPALLGLVLAVLGAAHIMSIRATAKADLKVADIGTGTGVTDAVITCVRMDDSDSEGDSLPPVWTVTYTYAVGNRLYRQYDYLGKDIFKIGDQEKAFYALSRPTMARLVRPEETLPLATGDEVGDASLPGPNPDPTHGCETLALQPR